MIKLAVSLSALHLTQYDAGVYTQARYIETDVYNQTAIQDYIDRLILDIFPEPKFSHHTISFVVIPE